MSHARAFADPPARACRAGRHAQHNLRSLQKKRLRSGCGLTRTRTPNRWTEVKSAKRPERGRLAPAQAADSNTSYDSFSKAQHRARIAHEIAKGKCAKLLVIASPDGADVRYYKQQLPDTQITAVNRSHVAGVRGKCVLQIAEMDDVLARSDDKAFDVVFYDSCSNFVSMTTLQHARRVTTRTLYLTLTTMHMKHGSVDLRRAYAARLAAAGFRVTHVEEYASRLGRCGAMLLFEARVSGRVREPLSEQIGSLAWIRCRGTPTAGLALSSTNGKLYYIGTVVDEEGLHFAVHFYDSAMCLTQRACRRHLRAGALAAAAEHKPYIEWHHRNVILQDVQRLRGA